jgi:two-component system nitrate/nitrite response regulator NarL
VDQIRHAEVASPGLRIDAIVVSQVRLYCDCLVEMLARDPIVQVRAGCATLEHALAAAATLRPGMVLLDASFPDGTGAAAQLRTVLPAARIVAVAVAETEETILSWAEAGITGYVPDTMSLSELPSLLRQICSGEQFCSSRIAGALLRRVGARPNTHHPEPDAQASLTHRERDILGLVAAGLTNKEIARRLDIGIGTTKTHVHNILGKLQLSNRLQIAAQLNKRDDIVTNRTLLTALTPIYTQVYTPGISSD